MSFITTKTKILFALGFALSLALNSLIAHAKADQVFIPGLVVDFHLSELTSNGGVLDSNKINLAKKSIEALTGYNLVEQGSMLDTIYRYKLYSKSGQPVNTNDQRIRQTIKSLIQVSRLVKSVDFDSEVRPQSEFGHADRAWVEHQRTLFDDRRRGINTWTAAAMNRYGSINLPVIAVIDTGVQRPNSEIDGLFLDELNLVEQTRMRDATEKPTTSCSFTSYHGTSVSGIIGSKSDSRGLVGVLPSAKMTMARVIDSCSGALFDAIQAALWAAGIEPNPVIGKSKFPAKVINMSLGTNEVCPSFAQTAFMTIASNKAIVLAAAGNGKGNTIHAPASCNNVVSVTSLDEYGDHFIQSRISSTKASVITHGVRVPSIDHTGRTPYTYFTGTSAATPIAASIAAMAIALNPEIGSNRFTELASKTSPGFLNRQYCESKPCFQGPMDSIGLLAEVQGLSPADAARMKNEFSLADPYKSVQSQGTYVTVPVPEEEKPITPIDNSNRFESSTLLLAEVISIGKGLDAKTTPSESEIELTPGYTLRVYKTSQNETGIELAGANVKSCCAGQSFTFSLLGKDSSSASVAKGYKIAFDSTSNPSITPQSRVSTTDEVSIPVQDSSSQQASSSGGGGGSLSLFGLIFLSCLMAFSKRTLRKD